MRVDESLLDWVQLARTPKIGPVEFFRLLDRHGSPGAALAWLGSPSGLAKAGIDRLWRRADVVRELEALHEMGGEILTHAQSEYPALLREIPNPPPVISCLGRLELMAVGTVAIVGARNASGNGCRLAKRLACGVSQAQIPVASGLARGIDTAAHEGGLQGIGSTVAVIASGLDITYPSENRGLMDQIIDQGLVITERPLGAAPTARHFPRRNRIISGLSRAIVVVEAAEKSGSLMTARLGLDHGREVMAVPGSPMDPRHRGTNRLLRDGAQMVEEVADILENIPATMREPLPQAQRLEPRRRPTVRASITPRQSSIVPASKLAERLLALLSPEPLAVDELIRQCHASAAEVQDELLQLEMEGRIGRHPGNRVALDIA